MRGKAWAVRFFPPSFPPPFNFPINPSYRHRLSWYRHPCLRHSDCGLGYCVCEPVVRNSFRFYVVHHYSRGWEESFLVLVAFLLLWVPSSSVYTSRIGLGLPCFGRYRSGMRTIFFEALCVPDMGTLCVHFRDNSIMQASSILVVLPKLLYRSSGSSCLEMWSSFFPRFSLQFQTL